MNVDRLIELLQRAQADGLGSAAVQIDDGSCADADANAVICFPDYTGLTAGVVKIVENPEDFGGETEL